MNIKCLCSLKSNVSHYRFLLNYANKYANFMLPCNGGRVLPYISRKSSTAASDDKYDYKVIYKGELAQKVRIIKIFSLSTSLIGLALQPALLNQMQLSLPLGLTIMLVTNIFVFTTPLLLHYITKRYVTEIMFNPTTKTFIATTLSLFLQKKSHVFTRDEVTDPRGMQMMCTIVVRDRIPLFFDETTFTDEQAYIYLMKYDEPLEWQIHESEVMNDHSGGGAEEKQKLDKN